MESSFVAAKEFERDRRADVNSSSTGQCVHSPCSPTLYSENSYHHSKSPYRHSPSFFSDEGEISNSLLFGSVRYFSMNLILLVLLF